MHAKGATIITKLTVISMIRDIVDAQLWFKMSNLIDLNS